MNKNNNANDNQPATQGFVRNEIDSLRKDLPGIVKNAMTEVIKEETTKLTNANSKWKNEILKSNDKVSKEYAKFESESVASQENYKNLEKRVTKIEQHTGLSTS